MLVLAGCGRPPEARPMSFPTLEPDPPFDPSPIGLADLKSVAGAASIALEIGPAPILRTQTCGADAAGAATAHGARCYRCTLAVLEPGPGDALHPLEPALRTLASTLLAYPHSFLRVARIERIALCRELVAERGADASEHIGGLADGSARRLMVNVGHSPEGRPEATLHHEVFHLFDHATAPGLDHHRDDEWERINPRSFRYGDASSELQAGFVNDYARTNPAEDKASVFEYLMSYPEELCARGADDPLLLAKARLLLSRIEAAVPPGLGEFARRKVPCLARR